MPPLIAEFKKDADKRLLSCPGDEAALRSRKSVKREPETDLLRSTRDLLSLAYLRPAFSFLIVDDTVLDKPKTDLNAHVLGVPAFLFTLTYIDIKVTAAHGLDLCSLDKTRHNEARERKLRAKGQGEGGEGAYGSQEQG